METLDTSALEIHTATKIIVSREKVQLPTHLENSFKNFENAIKELEDVTEDYADSYIPSRDSI